LVAAGAFFASSCKYNPDYQKTKSGVMYKIFSDGKDSLAKAGNILKLNVIIKTGIKDSVLQTTYGKMPLFVPVRTDLPEEIYSQAEVFPLLRKGDSAVMVQLQDTIMKKGMGMQNLPFYRKGDKIITIVKVLDVFASEEAATKDRDGEIKKEMARIDKEREADLVDGVKEMENWLAKNNIKAVKTGKGTFVAVKDPGNGNQADSGKYVSVRYEGKILNDGKMFESNMDTSKARPITFQLGTGGVIPGWEEGLKLFKKGGKGTLYIPGALAYGRNPQPNSPFKPNDALIFDIVMEDVMDSVPRPAAPSMPQPAQTAPPAGKNPSKK